MMERVNEWEKVVLGNVDHFVFTLVNCSFDAVGLVVVHGVTNR